jgi:hypothetical protein
VGLGTACGIDVHRVLKPYGALQAETPLRVTARTWAQSAYGEPVIHGSATGMAVVGIFSLVSDQISELSEKLLRVASSNS